MQPAFLKLTFRYLTDANSPDQFSKALMKLSHDEFKLKSQAYNTEGKFNSFSEMKANDGRANSLHYKCSFAVSGLIETLNKKIPGITDELGRPLEFETFSFELIESDINDLLRHKIAVHFITGELNLLMNAGDRLIVTKPGAEPDAENGFQDCITIRMPDGLAVSGFINPRPH